MHPSLIVYRAVSPNAGLTGLDKLTFGNVSPSHQVRHVAHLIVAVILMSWTLFLIWRECKHFVDVRQAWLASPQHLSLARTRTIALTNVPESVNSESGIREMAGTVGRLTGTAQPRPSNVTDGPGNGNGYSDSPDGDMGGVRKVWLSRKIKPLEKAWQNRDDECSRLEGGVGKLLKLGNKNERKGKTPEKQGERFVGYILFLLTQV